MKPLRPPSPGRAAGDAVPAAPQPVLLFDGECGLCQALVRSTLRRDRRHRLRFAPLQGAPAQAYLKAQGLPSADFDSLVFVPDWGRRSAGDYRLRTDGALAALGETDGLSFVTFVVRTVPRPLRDPLYRLVARVRHFLFGTARPGRLDHPAWRERFLPEG